MATLDDAVGIILDTIVEAIEGETTPDGLLPVVKAVIRGDKARPMPGLPTIWVVPQGATFRQAEYDSETWDLPISLAAVVKSSEIEEAARISQAIVVRARAIALGTRDLMNLAGHFVTDIHSRDFDPTARTGEQNRTLHWTDATIVVTFSVTEEPTTAVLDGGDP